VSSVPLRCLEGRLYNSPRFDTALRAYSALAGYSSRQQDGIDSRWMKRHVEVAQRAAEDR